MTILLKPRTDFTTSGGNVAADRLTVQVQQDPAITTALRTVFPLIQDAQFDFASALSAPEEAALDALIAAHSGVMLNVGSEITTLHGAVNPPTGTNVVNFFSFSTTPIGSIDRENIRIAGGPGQLAFVTVRTTLGATVTVQLVVNGSVVGAGSTHALAGGVPFRFTLPLDDRGYVADDEISVALTGLSTTSTTNVEANWTEAA